MHSSIQKLENIFEPSLLEEMNKQAVFHVVKEGNTILDIGQTVRVIPFVISGTIKISRIDDEGNELLLYYINPNESCAMTFLCCMQQFPSEIKATAEDDVEMFTIPITNMDTWLVKYQTWKHFVMKTIQVRFHELLKTIDHIAFENLDERLIHYLKEKSKINNSTLLNLSHTQIANDLASSREVISRLLKKLENNKKVILYRNQIKIMREL